jgi:GDPmannose 4,6-dehydratase
MKTAIVTGVHGMDGSILTDKLLAKGYKVIGVDRWSPIGISPNLKDAIKNENFIIESGDITERDFIHRIIVKYKPDYFYNMAAISLVPESFKIPLTIFETNTMAVVNMLEIIRTYSPHTRFYQASTSEQIGENTSYPQNNDSVMLPNSPYAIAKLASYHMVKMYRKAYGLFAVNGMLWNHEGPRRGPTFVTRKITLHISKQINSSFTEPLQIGNLDSFRDWGLADEYCDAMILIMESDKPDDYAVNTGESHSIREFIEKAYEHVKIDITWSGEGKDEVGYDSQTGERMVEVNEKYYRPVEVPYLHGDHTKIKEALGWTPKTKFNDIVKIMMESDSK